MKNDRKKRLFSSEWDCIQFRNLWVSFLFSSTWTHPCLTFANLERVLPSDWSLHVAVKFFSCLGQQGVGIVIVSGWRNWWTVQIMTMMATAAAEITELGGGPGSSTFGSSGSVTADYSVLVVVGALQSAGFLEQLLLQIDAGNFWKLTARGVEEPDCCHSVGWTQGTRFPRFSPAGWNTGVFIPADL